jgi:alcohol dehydrogenase
MTMRVLLLTDQGLAIDSSYPCPVPQPGEALIRVHLVGICATDLALVKGYKGGLRGVLGHEFVGEVVSAPDAAVWVGKRVVGEINMGCGHCYLCMRGLSKHCSHRQCLGIADKDGALAEFITLPVANLHEVPDDLCDEQAVFVEPLAAALEILEQVHITPSTRLFVVGDGRMGLLIAQVVALTGCDLTVLGHHPAHLGLLEEWLRCKTVVETPETRAVLMAEPADVVVEATGSAGGFAASRSLVRPGGTLVLKSTFAGEQPRVDLNHLVVDEVTVVGSRCGPFAPALQLLASGQVRVLPMIHARYELKDGVAAIEKAGQRGILKVLVTP